MQQAALKAISESLVEDPLVQAVFVKGSIARGEEDEFSDIDLYCLVKEEDKGDFLNKRIGHLEKYRKVLFYEDFFIIAPQIIAVYDNLLHVDLYTVTEDTFLEKDYFKVLYDPRGVMDQYRRTQNLRLTEEEFADHVYDVAWYSFQYRKALKRGNDIWASEMLHFVLVNSAYVLLHRYYPERAQLGMKALGSLLPRNKLKEVQHILNNRNPMSHKTAVTSLIYLLKEEKGWINSQLPEESQANRFLELMLSTLEDDLNSFY